MFISSTPRRIAMYWVSTGMLGAAAFMIAWSGCSSQATDSEHVARGGSQSMHAIHSEQLKRTMRDLSRDASSPEEVRYQAMAGTTSPDMSKLASTARSMRRTARSLPNLIGNCKLCEENRQSFISMASDLENAANELMVEARRNNLAGAKAAMQRLDATCTACHGTFRLPQPQ